MDLIVCSHSSSSFTFEATLAHFSVSHERLDLFFMISEASTCRQRKVVISKRVSFFLINDLLIEWHVSQICTPGSGIPKVKLLCVHLSFNFPPGPCQTFPHTQHTNFFFVVVDLLFTFLTKKIKKRTQPAAPRAHCHVHLHDK